MARHELPEIDAEDMLIRPGIWVTLPDSGLDVLLHPNQRQLRIKRHLQADTFGGWDVTKLYANASWRKTPSRGECTVAPDPTPGVTKTRPSIAERPTR
jgi:hypothetical protein